MLFFERIKQKISNKKIESHKEIDDELELKTIAEIPFKQTTDLFELIEHEIEKNNIYKAFKQMVTNIQFLCVNNVNDKKVMLITSPKLGNGKSYVTANLAVAFSKIAPAEFARIVFFASPFINKHIPSATLLKLSFLSESCKSITEY